MVGFGVVHMSFGEKKTGEKNQSFCVVAQVRVQDSTLHSPEKLALCARPFPADSGNFL